MKSLLLVALCGGAGAVARLVISAQLRERFGDTFPWGTWAVNVAGCFLIGVLFQWDATVARLTVETRNALAAGFLGGLTTFSTFGLESNRLFDQGRWPLAVANVLANVVCGLVAVRLGVWVVGRRI